MKNAVLKVLRDAFTGLNNQTYDFMRIFCALGIFVYLALAAVAFFTLKVWSPIEFAGGFSTVVAGATGGVYAHDRSTVKNAAVVAP